MGNLFVGILGIVVGISFLAFRRACEACQFFLSHVLHVKRTRGQA